MKKPLALITDDEPDIRELLSITLKRMGIESLHAENLSTAYALLEHHEFDICLVDMRLPDGNGIELISHINTHHPQLPAAVITAHGNMDSAIEALKAGAFDFLSKPVDLDVLRSLIKNALKLTEQKIDQANASTSKTYTLLGETEPINVTKKIIAKLARSQAPVYISGESGAGKELVAKMIHQHSARGTEPFIAVNCGAIPSELMESEFFGHIKGSFTGATHNKTGMFRAAEGGTLFLDEIAELPLHMQTKLLRVIQEKCIRPIGSNHELPLDIRILSATNQDLADWVQQGKFRQDLFYRINVIEIKIPALRERVADIPLLVDSYLKQTLGKQNIKLSKDAMEALQNYSFPGNIRELQNILERACTLCESNILDVVALQLPTEQNKEQNKEFTTAEKQLPLDSYLHKVEKHTILETLEKTRWNRTAAAKLLGISLRALRYKLKKLGLHQKSK